MAAMLFQGTGVELGVTSGIFSQYILKHAPNVTKLWSIDRWSDHQSLAKYQKAAELLASAGQGRCVPLRMNFREALPLFTPESLDFVYIDSHADPSQEEGENLRDWWTRIRPGGVLSGHDYHVRSQSTIDAVDRLAYQHGLTIQTTIQDPFPSWWLVKPLICSPPAIPLEIPACHTVCLVGNGPGVLHCSGADIDAHDVVIRFNRFRLSGFEQHTGRKTTIWSTFGHGSLPGDKDQRPMRVIFAYGEIGEPAYPPDVIHRLPRAFYQAIKQRVREYSKRTGESLERLGMTSGLVVAIWLLEAIGVQRLSLAGFDHFRKNQSKQHHYYNPRAYAQPPEHDGEAEAAILAPYVASGRVRYL